MSDTGKKPVGRPRKGADEHSVIRTYRMSEDHLNALRVASRVTGKPISALIEEWVQEEIRDEDSNL